jgi:hypothetical protein
MYVSGSCKFVEDFFETRCLPLHFQKYPAFGNGQAEQSLANVTSLLHMQLEPEVGCPAGEELNAGDRPDGS